jgi:hypothetical protein
LQSGDEYERLDPAVSICFLDGLLFPQVDEYHLSFGLWDARTQVTFSDHLAIHLFQLPRFKKSPEELSSPLDLWLYFLNNGKWLDPEHLPERLRVAEVEEAVEVLRKLTQEDFERERCEARERARRDALSWQRAKERLDREEAEMRLRQADIERQQADMQRQQADMQRQQADMQRQQAEMQLQKEEALAKGLAEGLIGQVRLCEQFLRRDPLPNEQLGAMSVEAMRQLVDELRSQLASGPTHVANSS